jgi:hypothetical protein
VNTRTTVAVLAVAALTLAACGIEDDGPDGPDKVTEKAFVAGGRVSVDIDSGDCDVRLAPDTTLRVTLSGNTGSATSALDVNGTQATVSVKNTPHNHFRCAVDVPKAEELRVSLGGGRLAVAAIATSTNVQNGAGDTEISVGNTAEYGPVDAAVGAGEIDAGPFGATHSGLAPNFQWSGAGKRSLSAHVGAGRLVMRN